MTTRVVDRVDGWNQRPFSGGFGGLQELADEEFSGVVRAGGAELFMTLGTAVAVRQGSIDDFEGASGTVFEAPVPALPLLAVMQEEDADVRAQYYTEETPISEVDDTLSSGGFTGFVELSENVLSGDYFLVYHGGKSMSVAYVGNTDELITDDEAFQTADDEVGIYKVRQVDVEPIEIPEESGDEAAEAAAAAATAEGGAEAEPAESSGTADDADTATETAADAEATDSEAEEAAVESEAAESTTDTAAGDEAVEESDAGSSDGTATETAATDATADAAAEERSTAADDADVQSPEPADTRPSSEGATDDSATETAQSGRSAADRETGSDRTTETADAAGAAETQEQTGRRAESSGRAERSSAERSTPEPTGRSGQRDPANDAPRREGAAGGGGGTTSTSPSRGGTASSTGAGAGDLETRSIPSLDPGRTQTPERSSPVPPTPDPEPATQDARITAAEQQAGQRSEPDAQQAQPREQASQGAASSAGTPEGPEEADREPDSAGEPAGQPADSEAIADLEADLEQKETEIERLERELADAEGAREDLEADLQAVREERDELSEQVGRLEEELERLEQEFGAATDAEQRMTPSEAIEGTNLFVEYDSKGNATLGDAHGGSESREEVAENLRLGVHTEFDDQVVAVGGQDFDEFLQHTLHYRFASWIVGDLLFEIRDTGHADYLPDLYDAIPEIRRVEFNGAVDVEYVEDGQEKGGRERFDVIFRHRMGDPLLVANLNDSRDPATGSMMTSLVTAAERVGQTEDALAGAFLVTSSFFESEALETVSEATQGGLLSRDSRKSFVNLSRKAGYHLCLVAARDENFHMEVPEL